MTSPTRSPRKLPGSLQTNEPHLLDLQTTQQSLPNEPRTTETTTNDGSKNDHGSANGRQNLHNDSDLAKCGATTKRPKFLPGLAAGKTSAMCTTKSNTTSSSKNKKKQRYDKILRETGQWIRELESVRDRIYSDSIQNAILLDFFAMQGLDDPSQDPTHTTTAIAGATRTTTAVAGRSKRRRGNHEAGP